MIGVATSAGSRWIFVAKIGMMPAIRFARQMAATAVIDTTSDSR